jgi:hypothetical protein
MNLDLNRFRLWLVLLARSQLAGRLTRKLHSKSPLRILRSLCRERATPCRLPTTV